MGKRPIDVWREKLELLQVEEAIASDPAQKFTLRKQIEEARQKIAKLENANPASDTQGKTESPAINQATTTESLEQTTQRVLGAYHRAVQQSWDNRWSGVTTEPKAADPQKQATDIAPYEGSVGTPSPASARHVEPETPSEEQQPGKFDVFLSHNSSEKPSVRVLGKQLQNRGLSVWLDEWELVPGRPWQEALEEILETAKAAAVLIGKDGLGPWHNREMHGCLSEFVDRALPVIPVLLPGTEKKPKLPLFLKQFTWVDLRDGFTVEGLDRLEWGITGRKPQR